MSFQELDHTIVPNQNEFVGFWMDFGICFDFLDFPVFIFYTVSVAGWAVQGGAFLVRFLTLIGRPHPPLTISRIQQILRDLTGPDSR